MAIPHVTALLTNTDCDMIHGHQKYVAEIHKRAMLGDKVLDAMTGAEKKLPSDSNYLKHTNRRTGQRSKHKPNAFDTMHKPAFEDETGLAVGEEDRAKWYSKDENKELRRLLKICIDLGRSNPIDFEVADVIEAFNDKYLSKAPKTCKTRVIKLLKDAKKDRLAEVVPCESKKNKRYSLQKSSHRLSMFLLKIREIRQERKGKRSHPEEAPEYTKRVKQEE